MIILHALHLIQFNGIVAMCTDENKKLSGGHACVSLFYKFRTSKDLEILRQSSYMSHILKGLSKRNTHIPHIALFDEDK